MRTKHFIGCALAVVALTACDEQEPPVAMVAPDPTGLRLESMEMQPGQPMPAEFTCDGAGINPSVLIRGIPSDTQTLALVVEDLNAAKGEEVLWVVYNMTPGMPYAPPGAVPEEALVGKNSANQTEYLAPCPPAGQRHQYAFRLFALNTSLEFAKPPTKDDLYFAIDGFVLDSTDLTVPYQRP